MRFEPARKLLLDQLKLLGPVSAAGLAQRLDITKMAVLQGLHALEEQGIVQRESMVGGRGRPTLVWHLTPAAQKYFPDAHAELAVSLISCIKETAGLAGLDALLKARSRYQIKKYRKEMADASSLGEKLRILAIIRSREGYMAEVKNKGQTYLFVEKHCPICIAATGCTGLCGEEMNVFRKVLGKKVKIERIEHLLQGSHRCAYKIR
jgi:predicted ArsR family transcriptional regulator